MTCNLRHAGVVALVAVSALGSLSASGPANGELTTPYVAISSLVGRLPNIDPLVDPYPFFLVRPWEARVPMTTTVAQRGGEETLDLPLEIQAMNFSGTVHLKAYCESCSNFPFDLSVIPNQISVGDTTPAAPAAAAAAAARFSESVLSPADGGASIRVPTASAVLKVSTRSSSRDAGSFLVRVDACRNSHCDPGTSIGSGYFVISRVVIPDDGTNADCPNVVSSSWRRGDEDPRGYEKPDDLPLQPLLRQLFIRKRALPAKRSFAVGVHAPDHNAGWDMLVDKPPASTPGGPVGPNEAIVRLVNPTRKLASLVAVGGGCSITGNIVLNPDDPPQELRISRSNTTTVVLTNDGEALGRFNDANFWTLAGGRRLTLTPVR